MVVLVVSVALVNFLHYKADHLDIRLLDWDHAALPVSLLVLSGLLINHFDMGMAATLDIAVTITALLLLSAFAGCGLRLSVKEFRLYQATTML
jgi:hypothetical protein